jgi:hypothetical protein
MAAKTTVITNRTALEDLLTRQRKEFLGAILLKLDGLEPSETHHWQDRINQHFYECGCSTGSAVMLLGVGLYLAFLVMRVAGIPGAASTDIALGLILCFGSAGVGKWLGLQRARYQLRQDIREINYRLADWLPDKPIMEGNHGGLS